MVAHTHGLSLPLIHLQEGASAFHENLPTRAGNSRRPDGRTQANAFLRGVSVQTEIRSGYAIDQICSAASQPDVDLIVISTHGRTGDSSMG